MSTVTISAMFKRLLRAEGQSRSAKTVEVFGCLILIEGIAILFAPHFAAEVLHFGPLEEGSANFFRLAGLLVSGLGMLYIVSGRLNARGFVFFSLLDRPLVPPVLAVPWYLGIVPGPRALAFSLQDFASFLWTRAAWQAESRETKKQPPD